MCRQWFPRPEEYVLQLLRRLLCMSAGLHMERCSIRHPVSDMGYRSEVDMYRIVDCMGCQMMGLNHAYAAI